MIYSSVTIEGKKTDVRFNVAHLYDASRWNVRRHNNSEYELHVVVQGSCTFELNEQNRDMYPGSAVLIAPGCYHGIKNITDDHVHFSITISGREKYFEGFVFFELPDEIKTLVDMFVAEGLKREKTDNEVMEAYIKLIVKKCWACMNISSEKTDGKIVSAAGVPARPISRTDEIDIYFQFNYMSSGGETELAERLHVSNRQLARILLANYGQTYREKLLSTRMDNATSLLRTTDMPMDKISEAVGYVSSAAFYRQFKKTYGMTPAEYRASKKTEGQAESRWPKS